MNTPFAIFIGLILVFFLTLVYFFHEVLKNLPLIIADHARLYARAYAKAICLILITTGGAFKEEFSTLTVEDAKALTWWGWAIILWMPVAAGLGVVIAFLDTSVANATAKKEEEVNTGTQSPFVKPSPLPQPQPPAQ